MNLTISDPSLSHVRLVLAPPTIDWGNDLQIKQHPHIAKFTPGSKARVVALKDASKSFPVGQSLTVLRWRYAGKDESYVPLSSEYLDIEIIRRAYQLST
jgi:coatomer subunit delta